MLDTTLKNISCRNIDMKTRVSMLFEENTRYRTLHKG